MSNENLHRSKRIKNDEFFTRISDVESELNHYSEYLHGKSIYLPCDDDSSAFWTYLMSNFEADGLERIVATRYVPGCKAFLLESSDGKSLRGHHLLGDGDFFSDECQALMKDADVVITNPPFSRLREFVTSLMDAKKDFLIIGPMNAITYKNIFPHIKHGRIRIGHAGITPMHFDTPDGSEKSVSCMWMTTFPIIRQCKRLDLSATYDPNRYPKYDNYDSIEVSKCKDIPVDYDGIMGVPITFLNYWQPEKYVLVGHEHDLTGDGGPGVIHGQFEVDGKGKFKRILIQLIGCSYSYGDPGGHEDGTSWRCLLDSSSTYIRLFIRKGNSICTA